MCAWGTWGHILSDIIVLQVAKLSEPIMAALTWPQDIVPKSESIYSEPLELILES